MLRHWMFLIIGLVMAQGAAAQSCSAFPNSTCRQADVFYTDRTSASLTRYGTGQEVCATRVSQQLRNPLFYPFHPEWGMGCEYDFYEGYGSTWTFTNKVFYQIVAVGQSCPVLDTGIEPYFNKYNYTAWFDASDTSAPGGRMNCVYCQPNTLFGNNLGIPKCLQIIDKNQQEEVAPKQCKAAAANPSTPYPIYTLMGTKVLPEPILAGRLTATFNSINQGPKQTDAQYPRQQFRAPLSFGGAWSSSLHKALTPQYDSQTGGVLGNIRAVQAARGNGQAVSFTWNVTLQKYVPVAAFVQDTLVGVTGGWLYFDASSRSLERYDAKGNLLSVHGADGATLTYTYSADVTPTAPGAGYLMQVQSDRGRTISFEYEAVPGGGRIKRILDEAGQAIGVAYDANGNLSSLSWPDGKQRQYLYENIAYKAALTGIVDENNTRFITYGYDAAGRAISSEHAGVVNRYAVSYPNGAPMQTMTATADATALTLTRLHGWTAPPAGDAAVVSQPTGATIGQRAALRGGTPGLTSQSQPAGSGCAASTSSLSYDANGNVASADDFSGNRTCYVNDATRNLESVRVEGLANTVACSTVTPANATLPTDSRKTSTQWHPDWRLAVRVAEPGKLTTSVYNGQPDPTVGNAIASCAPATALLPDGKPIAVLCKQVEQATTDVDGSKGFAATLQAGVADRVTRWTYNAMGQVLTEDGPRTDVSDVTTYAYYSDTTADHTLGDLQSVTNAAGKVTQYTKYNKHGQLLESKDANGVVTTLTYDARQRPLTITVGGQTTTLTYDAAGQLTQTSLADGSLVAYSYDAAHRLIAVSDLKGNRIDYQLDNAGNRIGETSKDPGGSLQRQLSRSIDALGRVQQTTGR